MPNPFISVINSLLPEPHASLLNGILFGIKESMPKYFYQSLVSTGVLHVIALSGMNITILANLTANVTLSAGRRKSCIATIFIILLFIIFVGPSPSIIRAAIMGSMSLLAVYFGRQSYAILSLFIASAIMLIIDFSLLTNLSFQLSFLSTLGIITAGKFKIRECRGIVGKIKYLIYENLKVTLFAQLFTMGVIIYNFHRISFIAPIANLLTGWIIQPIMVLGFITCIAGYIFQPLGMVAAWSIWVPLTYFIKVVEVLAGIPFASVSF